MSKPLRSTCGGYLDLQAFLDECRADGVDTARAAGAVGQARREILDALDGSQAPDGRPLTEATRAYLDAEHQFDLSSTTGAELDVRSRRMERARRDLERQLRAVWADERRARRDHRSPSGAPATPPRARRILVAYDESAPARYALDVAAQTARETHGKLLVVYVAQPAGGAGGDYVSSLERLDALHHRHADEMLAKARRDLAPLEVDQAVRDGVPADEILAAAKAFEADLIVMGRRARGRLTQFLLGSTAESVIRRAPCPVTTVGRRAAWASEGESHTHSDETVTAANRARANAGLD